MNRLTPLQDSLGFSCKEAAISFRLLSNRSPLLNVIHKTLLVPYFAEDDRDNKGALHTYLAQNHENYGNRVQFYVVAAVKRRRVVGTTIFAFFGWKDFCIMSGHYTAVLPEERGKHLSSQLDDLRQRIASQTAKRFGYAGLDLSVISIPIARPVAASPPVQPFPAKLWLNLGYRRLDFTFLQLPLSQDKRLTFQTLWVKRHSARFEERCTLSSQEVERIVEAANHFRNSHTPPRGYSAYKKMLRRLREVSHVRIIE